MSSGGSFAILWRAYKKGVGGGAKEEVGVGGGGVLRKLNLVHSGHLFFFSLHQQHSVPPGNLILYRRWRFAVEMPSCFFFLECVE